MLVLSRGRDESIVCTIPAGLPAGSEIVFTVVDLRGDKVRIGIKAPDPVAVHREEVNEKIKSEGREDLRQRKVNPCRTRR